MADRYVLLREPGRHLFHIPAPDDDLSTLCGEAADEMDGEELRDDQAVIVCGACMKAACR